MPSTTLPLETFRSQFSLGPFHFWQQADTLINPVSANCDDLVYEYAYQSSNNSIGRQDIKIAIDAACLKLQQYLGYSPVPHFVSPALVNPSTQALDTPKFFDASQYRVGYAAADGRWLSLQLPEGKVRQIGVERLNLLATANAGGSIALQTVGTLLLETGGNILLEATVPSNGAVLNYTDNDGDGLIDTFTITFTAASLIDADTLECYFNDRDGEQPGAAWKIEPIKASINSGTLLVTITGKAWTCVPPQNYQGVAATAFDPTTDAIFTASIDVYSHTCDSTGTTVDDCQAVLIWETSPYPTWATPFAAIPPLDNWRDPAAVAYAIARVGVRDAEAGLIYFGEAIYDATQAQWIAQRMSNSRPPDRILVRYYAGDDLSKWSTVIARFAAAELGKRICACDSANKAVYLQQVDRAFTADSRVEGYNLAPEDLGNPLGTKTGQIQAWRAIYNLRQIKPVIS